MGAILVTLGILTGTALGIYTAYEVTKKPEDFDWNVEEDNNEEEE